MRTGTKTERYRQTLITRLIVAFHNFASTPVRSQRWYWCKYLKEEISHALGTRICDKNCVREGGVGVTVRGAWYWRNSADTRWWRIIPRAKQSACRTSSPLHSAAATSWHATSRIRKISKDTEILLQSVQCTFEVYNEGNGINTMWWRSRTAIVPTVFTEDAAAGPVHWERLFLTELNQEGSSRLSPKTTGTDPLPITLASFLKSGR